MRVHTRRYLAQELAELSAMMSTPDPSTKREIARERLALLEEVGDQSWMKESPAQLARKIPTSVFVLAEFQAGARPVADLQAAGTR